MLFLKSIAGLVVGAITGYVAGYVIVVYYFATSLTIGHIDTAQAIHQTFKDVVAVLGAAVGCVVSIIMHRAADKEAREWREAAIAARPSARAIPTVVPVDPSQIELPYAGDTASGWLMIVVLLGVPVEVLIILANLISGGTLWLWGLLVLAGAWVLMCVMNLLEYESTFGDRKARAAQQAEYYSQRLNLILTRSAEIVDEILPYYEQSAVEALQAAHNDFASNAIYPFWNHVQEASKCLACYKEAVDQLAANGEMYTAVLIGKKHSFPTPFPVTVNRAISDTILSEYQTTVQNALSGPDISKVHQFTNIWLQMRTNEILIAGFQTLEQAIQSVGAAIVNAIGELRGAVESGFTEIRQANREALRTFESSQAAMRESLQSMDTKLYYIQYRQRPRAPFFHRS